MARSNGNETLRNFMIEDELYYDLEYIAQHNERNTKDQLIFLIRSARDQFLRDGAIKKVPRTDKRLNKLKAEKKKTVDTGR